MEIKEILKFIDEEDKKIKQMRKSKIDDRTRILGRTIKIMEELGELSNEVLAHSAFQRKEKLKNYKKEHLEEEFADVIFSTLMLAKTLNVNVEEVIKKRMEKLRKRKYKI